MEQSATWVRRGPLQRALPFLSRCPSPQDTETLKCERTWSPFCLRHRWHLKWCRRRGSEEASRLAPLLGGTEAQSQLGLHGGRSGPDNPSHRCCHTGCTRPRSPLGELSLAIPQPGCAGPASVSSRAVTSQLRPGASRTPGWPLTGRRAPRASAEPVVTALAAALP